MRRSIPWNSCLPTIFTGIVALIEQHLRSSYMLGELFPKEELESSEGKNSAYASPILRCITCL